MLKVVEGFEYDTRIEHVFECLRLVRDLFAEETWDEIVENIALLRQNAQGDD